MSHISMPGKPLILLAEDDVMVRNLVRSFLQRRSFDLLCAANGSEAVKLSQDHDGTIDLLLTDIEMPLMDGVSAYRHIAQQRPDMEVIFMSGGVRHLDIPGRWSFLPKPLELPLLLAKVSETIAAGLRSFRPEIAGRYSHPH